MVQMPAGRGRTRAPGDWGRPAGQAVPRPIGPTPPPDPMPYEPYYPSPYPQPYTPYGQPAGAAPYDDGPQDWKTLTTSKTFWSGVSIMAMSAASLVQGQQFIQEKPALVAALGIVIGGLMIFLRLLTKRPVRTPLVTIRPQHPKDQIDYP